MPEAYGVTERAFDGRIGRQYAECTCGWQGPEREYAEDVAADVDYHDMEHRGNGCPCTPCTHPTPNVQCDFEEWENDNG